MAKTDNLGLNVWGENENSGMWLAWRLAMAGTSSDSNMQILDAWAKAVDEKIANVQSTLTFDETPTEGSTNPVTSGGIKTALDQKQDELSFDDTPMEGSDNPVTSGGVYAAIQAHTAKPDLNIRCEFFDTSSADACQGSTVFEYSAEEVLATYGKLSAVDEQPVVVSLYGEVKKGDSTQGHTLTVTDVTTSLNQLHISFMLTPSLVEGLPHVFCAELTFTISGAAVTSNFVVTPIDGTTDIGLDDTPTESSENLVTSGGVWDALEGKADRLDLTTHMIDTNIHVTADEKTAWNAKQAKITASGLLKGNGQGAVTAAVAGTDYATAAHDHEGAYCTPEALEDGLVGKAPVFSPVVELDMTNLAALYNVSTESNGQTFLVRSGVPQSDISSVFFNLTGDDSVPIGTELEIVWTEGTRSVCVKPVSVDGSYLCELCHTLGTNYHANVYLSSLYSVAVLKKIGTRSWVISGDITL